MWRRGGSGGGGGREGRPRASARPSDGSAIHVQSSPLYPSSPDELRRVGTNLACLGEPVDGEVLSLGDHTACVVLDLVDQIGHNVHPRCNLLGPDLDTHLDVLCSMVTRHAATGCGDARGREERARERGAKGR